MGSCGMTVIEVTTIQVFLLSLGALCHGQYEVEKPDNTGVQLKKELSSTTGMDSHLRFMGRDFEEARHIMLEKDNFRNKRDTSMRQKEKEQLEKRKEKKLSTPVSRGCIQLCDTLIFDVYKILGGNVCGCSRRTK